MEFQRNLFWNILKLHYVFETVFSLNRTVCIPEKRRKNEKDRILVTEIKN